MSFSGGDFINESDLVPLRLDRYWFLPLWAQELAVKTIEILDDGLADIEGCLVIDDLQYLTSDPFDPAPDPENFSHRTVAAGITKLVPANQQMVINGEIDLLGTLDIEGSVSILWETDADTQQVLPEDNFSYDFIPLGQTASVPLNQQMFVDYPVTVEGTLEIIGRVVVNNDYALDPPGDNFGYRLVPLEKTLKILPNQDMLVADNLEIIGTVDAEGSFTVFYF